MIQKNTIFQTNTEESHFSKRVKLFWMLIKHHLINDKSKRRRKQNFFVFIQQQQKHIQSVKIWFVIIVIENAMQKIDQYKE